MMVMMVGVLYPKDFLYEGRERGPAQDQQPSTVGVSLIRQPLSTGRRSPGHESSTDHIMSSSKRSAAKGRGGDASTPLMLKIESFEDSFCPFRGQYFDVRVLLLDADGQLQVRCFLPTFSR